MILVTGGTGLLGSHLLYYLASGGNNVRATYRNPTKIEQVKRLFSFYSKEQADVYFEQIEWVQADVLDIPALEQAFQDVTIVYHLAAIVSYNRKDFSNMMKTNREGTANMVNLALDFGVEKFCFISSTSAVSINYEDRKAPLIEANKWVQTTNTSGYAISKYSSEKEVWRGIEEGLNAVIINPSIILGAGNWGESSLKIVQLAAKGFPFYSAGANAVVDVRDVVECMLLCVKNNVSPDRYLCTGTMISFHDLMNQLADELGTKRPKWKTNKLLSNLALFGDFIKGIFSGKRTLTRESIETAMSTTTYDSSKLKRVLNFEFRPLEDTIKFTAKGRNLNS
ncbi:MAG TPA: NAD-dependent epimerase/dehydratase family protein [Crocinitomicaceae bacterium]|nr:NAD-dependent epimerase/dehydratase family protein [Crocinitomicaceae bacterium]